MLYLLRIGTSELAEAADEVIVVRHGGRILACSCGFGGKLECGKVQDANAKT